MTFFRRKKAEMIWEGSGINLHSAFISESHFPTCQSITNWALAMNKSSYYTK